MKPQTQTEYRIYIDDVSGKKISTFAAQQWSIREIGFEDGKPVFWADELTVNLDVKREWGNPSATALEAYKKDVLRKLDILEFRIRQAREALIKDYVLESEINPPEEKIPLAVEAKLTRAFEFVNNEFTPPSDFDDNVNITELVRKT